MKSVAIDGPAGAGKSTLAKQCAKELGFIYVDTGAIYRCVALYAVSHGIDTKDAAAVEGTLASVTVDLGYDESGSQRMQLCGEDVTDKIRTPEVSAAASAVAAVPAVRAFLLEMQRELARHHNVIMDGRDIGTVVLPDADAKIFLTASPEARAKRRWLELQEKGISDSYEKVLEEIIRRDRNDSTRAVAPLKQAEDAILLDTSDLSKEESLRALVKLVSEKIG